MGKSCVRRPAGLAAVGIVSLAAALTGVAPRVASASSAAGLQRSSAPKWSAASIPEPPGSFDGKLSGATCASPTDCLAVGWGAATGALLGTLVEQWNGKLWEPQPSPDSDGRRRHVPSAQRRLVHDDAALRRRRDGLHALEHVELDGRVLER